MRSLGKKIKGKKKTEEKECDNDDYWNDKSIHQRTKINFDSDEVLVAVYIRLIYCLGGRELGFSGSGK